MPGVGGETAGWTINNLQIFKKCSGNNAATYKLFSTKANTSVVSTLFRKFKNGKETRLT